MLLELERLGQIGVLAGLQLVGVRGVRHPEVVGSAKPQIRIDAGAAACVEEGLLGSFVVRLDELLDARVECLARVAVLALIIALLEGKIGTKSR